MIVVYICLPYYTPSSLPVGSFSLSLSLCLLERGEEGKENVYEQREGQR